jgi:chaperonin GroES
MARRIDMLKPLRDCIIVEREAGAERTASGLFIAHVDEKHVTGTVIAVGAGNMLQDGRVMPLEVAAGDSVVFNKHNAIEVKDDGKTLYILKEDQVLAIKVVKK